MTEAPIPADDEVRLAALRSYEILDTSPEPAFDDITALAAHILGVPIALVTLVDVERQWFKSHYGLDAPQTPRDVSFCGHVVASRTPLIVENSLEDERFADNPLVTGEPRVIFYAGFPLQTMEGFVLGTLCAIDNRPRQIPPDQLEMLAKLSRQVVAQLELRRQNLTLIARQAELSVHKEFFQLTLDLFCTVQDGHFRALNPAWDKLLGWTREDLSGRPWLEFVHPDDRQSTSRQAELLLLEPGKVAVLENRCGHRDGHWIPLSWVAAAKDGVLYATARDITEYKNKESALTASETRLRTIFDTAFDGILTFRADGTTEEANRAAKEMFGYSELQGQPMQLLLPQISLQDQVAVPVQAMRQDGSSFPGELSLSGFGLDNTPHWSAILRDVSERRKIERLQSEFVATVSHELRTPLTSVRGALGLVAGGITGELPAEAHEYIGIALANCDRLIRLINDLLDLERMSTGNLELRLQTLELRKAVQSCVANHGGFALPYGVSLRLKDPLPEGEVLVDADRLDQVLGNFLSNAIKFSPPQGSVEVSITQPRREWLRVSVRDWGPGISPEFRNRLFQRFAQEDAADNRKKGGTGLGLSISKTIIDRMRGRIGFESCQDGGSCFFFELPQLPTVAMYSQAIDAQRPTILVCEDDPTVSRLIEKLLADAGFAVHLSPTLERARRLLAVYSYRAITLDLRLADGDGTSLLKEIRANPATRLTPVVVVSGTLGALEQAAFLVSDVVVKPFEESRLLEAIAAAIANTRGENPTVLHVEDDPDIRRIIRRILPPELKLFEADSLQSARVHLRAQNFDLVLLDLTLPDGGGEDLIGDIGETPILIFSALEVSGQLAERVSAALVKTKSSATQLRDTILSLARRPHPHEAQK